MRTHMDVMSFSLDPSASIAEELKRTAAEQIERARAELSDEAEDRHEAVHLARKRFKKIRGLLRLARPGLGEDYAIENARWRDIARELSVIRDATALLETHDALTSHFGDRIEDGILYSTRQRLDERRAEMTDKVTDLDERIDATMKALDAGEKRLDELSFPDDFETVAEGFAKTYKRLDKGYHKAKTAEDSAVFHDWRKRAKYHWVHLKLLRKIWPEPMKARRAEAKALADILGDEHDLAVYRGTLIEEPKLFGKKKVQELLLALLDRRQSELRSAALDIGAKLCAESPDALSARMTSYWEAAEEEAQKPREHLATSAAQDERAESS